MTVKKIKCDHLDQLLEYQQYQDYVEGRGNDYDYTYYVSGLVCKGCGKKVEERNNYTYPKLNFEQVYQELTGRTLRTENDANQINLLRVNPELFWQFEPSNAKYLVHQVPEQWKIQEELNEALKNRVEAGRKLKEAEVAINKICKKGGRPTPFFAKTY